MILDKIENINRYQLPQKEFDSLKEFITSYDKNVFQLGRFEIYSGALFGIGLKYETKNEDKCLWEAHRKYIDVHVLLEGEEKVFINDINNMKASKSYDEDGDYALFEGNQQHIISLKKGDFLILYPDEVHKTSIISNKSNIVDKVVFKLKL